MRSMLASNYIYIYYFFILFTVNVECDRLSVSSLDSFYVHILLMYRVFFRNIDTYMFM